MKNQSLKNSIEDLEELFAVLNDRYFDSDLVKPIITISPTTTKISGYGWCTAYKVWKDKDGGDGYFEINICAEHLARPFSDVAATMLHEMVHLDNLMKGIKDTSRGGTYHNKRFKETAEAHGLLAGSTEKYGFSDTMLDDGALAEVEDFMDFIDKTSFEIYRQAEAAPEKKGAGKSSSRKYVCPKCGMIIRATKEVKVICADCDELLIEQ